MASGPRGREVGAVNLQFGDEIIEGKIEIMASASNSIDISRPAAEVYQFVADGLNNPKWRSAVIGISLASGTPGAVGTVYMQTLKGPLGSKVAGDYRIVEAIPNSRLKFEVITGPARPVGLFELSQSGDGCRLSFSLSLQPTGLMRLMDGMIQRTMDAEVQNLSALKTAIEAR